MPTTGAAELMQERRPRWVRRNRTMSMIVTIVFAVMAVLPAANIVTLMSLDDPPRLAAPILLAPIVLLVICASGFLVFATLFLWSSKR
jgi:hypothetical protein